MGNEKRENFSKHLSGTAVSKTEFDQESLIAQISSLENRAKSSRLWSLSFKIETLKKSASQQNLPKKILRTLPAKIEALEAELAETEFGDKRLGIKRTTQTLYFNQR